MTSFELLACVTLIALSAYLSASEVALFSLTRFQVRFLRENFKSVHRHIKRLLGDPGGVLITILVLNELINISVSSIIAQVVNRWDLKTPGFLQFLPNWAFETVIGVCVTTPLVLFLCEATPKVIAARMNQLVVTATAGSLSAIYTLFRPIRFLLKRIIHLIPHTQEPPVLVDPDLPGSKKSRTLLKESDFLILVEEGRKEGDIQENELKLIRNVFELDHATVEDVATSIHQVLHLPSQMTIKSALEVVRAHHYSRIPVMGSGPHRKEVVGILYSKDLLRLKLSPESGSNTISTIMRKPFFVHQKISLNDLFKKFKQNKIHMAIVRNHHKEVTGVITMSDILDTLFEELFEDDFEPSAQGLE
ncbi:MAG: CNNM domain-containing protein [Bdellovibrionia bacterium]